MDQLTGKGASSPLSRFAFTNSLSATLNGSLPESPQFVYREVPYKNATGSSHLGKYVLQTENPEAETHYEHIEEKTRPCGQAEHNEGFPVSGRLECDPAVQEIVETDAHKVTRNRGGNGVEAELLHEQNQHAELNQGRRSANAGELPHLRKEFICLAELISKPGAVMLGKCIDRIDRHGKY